VSSIESNASTDAANAEALKKAEGSLRSQQVLDVRRGTTRARNQQRRRKHDAAVEIMESYQIVVERLDSIAERNECLAGISRTRFLKQPIDLISTASSPRGACRAKVLMRQDRTIFGVKTSHFSWTPSP
jgi:hypothetical protein